MSETIPYNSEFDPIWAKISPYTMTSRERAFALWTAVNSVIDNGIPGAFVECGVWKGGSSMLIALTLLQRGMAHRDIFLFDTFSGMTEPGPSDLDLNDQAAGDLMAGSHGLEIAELVRAEASIDSVRAAMQSTGYDMRLVRFIAGDVRETLGNTQTLNIALLRLDTDFYDSTIAELHHLYPRLEPGGIFIVDDYGHWQGAKKAVDEYFSDPSIPYARPMLWAIDYTGRGGVKIGGKQEIEIERYDYIPPGMSPPDLQSLFPYAEPGNPWAVDWPYLRRETPHIWRSDVRNTGYVTGNASAEEAACLHHFARQFAGMRGVEIGVHFGWTSAHLLAAGLKLDCIDPAIEDPARQKAIAEVLDAVPNAQMYRLWAGYSPDIVKEVRDSASEPWSFAFIDGNHDGDAPHDDAVEVLKYLAEDCMVVFHDLTSPYVEKGLAVFRDAGFSTKIINTMQILGVAWRGNVKPPEHVPDPNVPHIYSEHLTKYL